MRQISLKCMRTLLEAKLADAPCDFSDDNITSRCPRCHRRMTIVDASLNNDVLILRCSRGHVSAMDCSNQGQERVN